MKKLILILLTFGMLSGTAFAGPPETDILSEKKGLGGRRQGDQAAVIVLVRNSGASASSTALNIVSADAVVYDTNSDDGVSVRLTTTSADGALAGIAVTAITSSDATSGTSAFDDNGRRNWGYILVHGRCLAKTSAGGTNGNNIGDAFITSVDSGAITTFALLNSDAGGVNSALKTSTATGGFFYDAAVAGATFAEVQVDLE